MKGFIETLWGRIKKLVFSVISPTFLSWVVVIYMIRMGWLNVTGAEFLFFTAAIIGLKSYFRDKGEVQIEKKEP